MTKIKCPIHGDDFDTLYPEKDSKAVKLYCGCIVYRNNSIKTNQGLIKEGSQKSTV